MNEEFNTSNPIEAELQVRLMNLVMGEASDFERDQLQLMMEQRPEVAVYYQNLEHLNGLMRELGTGDRSIDIDDSNSDDAWKLSADRRDKLLTVLNGQDQNLLCNETLANRVTSKNWRIIFTEAVAVVLAASVLIGLILPAVQSVRQTARRDGIKEGRDVFFHRDLEESFAAAAAPATSSSPILELTPELRSELGNQPSSLDTGSLSFDYSEARTSNGNFDDGLQKNVDNFAGARFRALGSSVSGGMGGPSSDLQSSDGRGLGGGGMGPNNIPANLADSSETEDYLYRYGVDRELARGRSSEASPANDSGLMETLPSRLIIPQSGKEKTLGLDSTKQELPSLEKHDRKMLAESGEGEAKDGLTTLGRSLDARVNWALPVDSAERDSNFFGSDVRAKDSISERWQEGWLADREQAVRVESVRLWMDIPAPSPELALSSRDRIELERQSGALKPAEAIDEQLASVEAFSTFSLHVSDVSFKLAQLALSQGQWPDATRIRVEEFINALDYHDPLPIGNQKVACLVEQAIHPFLMQRNLLRVSMRTAATGRSQNTPLRLTLLLDNSGSMERPDRRQAVLRSFKTLMQQLTPSDQITLISFASMPRLLAEKVPGDQGETLLQLIENLPSEGGTNMEAALILGREKATEQLLAGAQNRIVLLTDGAVNLGNANPESLATLVTQMRDSGIAFDAAGISAQELNDEVLEALTRQGDGRYYLLDSVESVSESFASQIAGALRPSAQNVKVQVEFNPQRVGRYKLLGFEKHRLNKEDFRNDLVDAAEMAAAEAGVALYHFEVKPNGSGDVGNVSVRFLDLSTGLMVERRWPIPYESNTPRLEQAEPTMQLATAAAMFAVKLGGGPLADSIDLDPLQKLLSNLPQQCSGQQRVQQLKTMIDQAKAIGQ